MTFKVIVKDSNAGYLNGDPLEIAPSAYDLTVAEDYTKWIDVGNSHESWPKTFYIIHITNAELDGTEAEVQYILAPYDISDPDATFKKRYNVQLSGQHIIDVQTVYATSMSFATFEALLIDRLA